jgi:hypothetical protein
MALTESLGVVFMGGRGVIGGLVVLAMIPPEGRGGGSIGYGRRVAVPSIRLAMLRVMGPLVFGVGRLLLKRRLLESGDKGVRASSSGCSRRLPSGRAPMLG